MKTIKFFLPATLGLMLLSCSEGTQTNEQLAMEAMEAPEAKEERMISDEAISSILNSIPSPLEISSMIKETGGEYQKSLLNKADNSGDYNSSFKRAVNLGIYSTDLGYINIYNENTDALSYLSSVKDLADGLNIGHFFDMVTIRRLASNSNNIDSLLQITTNNFEKINHFLQENKRAEQSVLILSGGWLEALNISCQVYKKNPNQAMKEKIAEQKIILDQLLLLLSNYPNDPNAVRLTEDFKRLNEVFNQIEIINIYKEPTMKEVNGMLVIVDESESKINVKEENIQDITRITEEIRNNLIS